MDKLKAYPAPNIVGSYGLHSSLTQTGYLRLWIVKGSPCLRYREWYRGDHLHLEISHHVENLGNDVRKLYTFIASPIPKAVTEIFKGQDHSSIHQMSGDSKVALLNFDQFAH